MRLSLHRQVVLLGALVAALIALAIGALAGALRSGESAVVGAERRRVTAAAQAVANAYAAAAAEHPTWAPAGSGAGTDSLAAHALRALARDPALDAGLYVVAGDRLIGHGAVLGPTPPPGPVPALPLRAAGPPLPPPPPGAEPPRAGPRPMPPADGPAREGPRRDRAELAAIARAAARLGRDTAVVLQRPEDLIVVVATPIVARGPRADAAGAGAGASAWAATRVPGFRAGQRRQTNRAGVVLVVGALGAGLLAFGVARSVRRGVDTLGRGLAALEHDLGARILTAGQPTEIATLGAGVNRLADGLRRQMAEARQAEERLRHAERLAALGRFTAGVAHEVRNPLATMRLRAQLIESAAGADAGQRRAAAVIVAEADRLNALVERLLTFSRPAPLAAAPVDLAGLAARRLDAYRARAAAAGVTVAPLAVPPPGTPALAAGDADALAQVIDNVVQNAIEAMAPAAPADPASAGGTLAVRVAAADGQVTLEVRDDGPGPSDEAARHAFEPFFTTRARGTGLGLAISYEIVRAHGGAMRLTRGEGPPGHAGAVVVVMLPAPAAAAPAMQAPDTRVSNVHVPNAHVPHAQVSNVRVPGALEVAG